MNTDLLVTCASWEDRFALGFRVDLDEYEPRRVIIFYYDGFANWTDTNRTVAREACRIKNIECVELQLEMERPAENWKLLQREIARLASRGSSAHIDISTMPRELIWSTFWTLEANDCSMAYTYHRPAEYNSDWLSRDPGSPRFVYKMSGLTKLGHRTALVILTGFDAQRADQLIRFYEPAVTLIGLQTGDLNAGNATRMQEQRDQFSEDSTVVFFDLDSFAEDHGRDVVLNEIRPYLGSHNVIMSSLGPKLTSVAIYQIHRTLPEIGVAYAPSKEFNHFYSRGLASSFTGSV